LSKLMLRTGVFMLLGMLTISNHARGQEFSAYFGLGTATNSAGTTPGCASKFIFDNFTGNCEAAPTMGGLFGVFGADYMFRTHLGFSGEYAFRFAQASYLPDAGIKARPAFYDVNAIYQPLSPRARIVPVLEGGVGGAKTSLYFSQQACATATVCNNQSSYFASANHFQLHGAVGVKIYVKPNIFIKPQFDLHWVHNMDQEYGRNVVPQYTIAVGYTFGRP
jgi:hypothetical protein